MGGLFDHLRETPGLWMLVGAVGALYVAARTAFDLVTRSPNVSAGRLAIVQWLPIAMVAVVATLMRRPEIAVGVIFATSVASLTLVFGLTAMLAPTDLSAAPGRRAWPFVLAAGMLVLLAGFSAHLSLLHAGILIVEAFVVLPLWRDPNDNIPRASEESAREASGVGIALLLTFLLVGIGAWAAVIGTTLASRELRLFSPAVSATIVLSPALVLPMIGSGSIMAHRRQTHVLLSSQVAVVLLNLLALLPLSIGCWYATQLNSPISAAAPVMADPPSTAPAATAPSATTLPTESSDVAAFEPRPLPFPIGIWRVDTVVLVALGFMLIPLSGGKWKLGRIEGLVLVVVYLAYLLAASHLIAPRL